MTAQAAELGSNQTLVTNLRAALRQMDDFAFENVTHDESGASILNGNGEPIEGREPRGGPFGAILAISLEDQSMEMIGKPRGNNVIASGIASQHAEDQAMKADNYGALIDRLRELKRAGREATVWMISSGQSCPSCHTKQEIVARELIKQGLIKPRQFNTIYGATFDDTFKIAQFYDAQYADAMIFSVYHPTHPGNLIQHERVNSTELPGSVRFVMENAMIPTAVVVRDGGIYALSRDQRTFFKPFATAEVAATQMACTIYRGENPVDNFESWKVNGVIYTTTLEMGPLMFAETGWTQISTIKSVVTPRSKTPAALTVSRPIETVEAVDIANSRFLNTVTGGYHDPKRSIQVYRDESYENRAQPMWAKVLKKNQRILYNGAAVSDSVLQMRNRLTRYRFAAYDIHHFGRSKLALDARPLAALSVGPTP